MPNSRQLDQGVLVRSYGLTFSQPRLAPPISEDWDQLIYAIKGVVTVRTQVGIWVVPPHRGVWLPANTTYTLTMSGETALRMIYLPKRDKQPQSCAVVSISPLLKELILRTVQIGALLDKNEHHKRIAGLIEDEIATIDTVPLQLPTPQNPLAQAFIEATTKNSDLNKALSHCGTSKRTMERLFQKETQMSLGQWLRRRNLLQALQMLVQGETTAEIAFTLGYNSPSAFIAMFKRELGSTPGEYLATR